MEFGEALRALKDNMAITNENWNGHNMYLVAQYPDENSKMTLPYIYMVNSDGENVPWLASQQDMFSDRWEIIGDAQDMI